MTPFPLPTICILAGGLGTRLGSRVADTPKPLISVAGEPFLVHQLRLLAHNGATRAVMCVGYLGEQIEHYIGNRRFGIDLLYSYDGAPLAGTLGAIRQASHLLDERFLVLYGDTYLRIDYRAFADGWQSSGLAAAMSVLHNEGRWDSSNVLFQEGRLVHYNKHYPTPDMAWIDYGLGGLTTEALSVVSEEEKDLSELYRVLSEGGQVYGFEAQERFFEIGTPTALEETDKFLRQSTL